MRLFFVFLLFPTLLVFGQSQEIDSLKSALSTASSDNGKVDLLVRLARAYQYHPLVDLEHYASEAINLADEIDYENWQLQFIKSLSADATLLFRSINVFYL